MPQQVHLGNSVSMNVGVRGLKSSLEPNTRLSEQHLLNNPHEVMNLSRMCQPQLYPALPQNSGRQRERKEKDFPICNYVALVFPWKAGSSQN